MRRFLTKRNLLIAACIVMLAMISAGGGLWLLINSPATNERIRLYTVDQLQARTGGKVTLGQIWWSVRQQRLVLEDLTVRGSETDPEPPLAHIAVITAGVNLRSLLDRRIDLFELTVDRPQFHLLVDASGRTNLPTPVVQNREFEQTFSIAIDSLKVTNGSGLINDRRFPIDLALRNLTADLSYRSALDALAATVRYEGSVTAAGQRPFPYTLSAKLDATRGTVLVQRADLASARSSLALQGRIDHVWTPDVSGKLEYSGEIDSAIASSWMPDYKLAAVGKTKGTLEFAPGTFSTKGLMSSEKAEFNGTTASKISARYEYKYPERSLKLSNVSGETLGGKFSGTAATEVPAAEPRITAEVRYAGIDVPQLKTLYPWTVPYAVFSRVDGTAKGWIEDRGKRFEMSVQTELTAYPPVPAAGITALPINGSLDFVATPAGVTLSRSSIRFFDTVVDATGTLQLQDSTADLNVDVHSTDLANLYFLYPGANGSGSFQGRIKGPVRAPQLEGRVVLDNHRNGTWLLRHAEGTVALDTTNKVATVALNGTLGESSASIAGTASLDGKQVNLRVQSTQLNLLDFASALGEKIEGTASSDVTLTSLSPLALRGHVRGARLVARGIALDAAEGDVTLNDPNVQVRNLTASGRGAKLNNATLAFNRNTEAVDFRGDITSLELDQFRDTGIPDTVQGRVPRVRLQVGGTLTRPQISGEATAEALELMGEQFPRAQVTMRTEWPRLNVAIDAGRNIGITGSLDMSAPNYPFQAVAQFQNYSLERLAGFTQGQLEATGDVKLSGSLAKDAEVAGTGTIRSIHAKVGQYLFDGAKPFGFGFDANRLVLTDDAILSGALGTRVTLKGTVGLSRTAKLDLGASGNVDLGVLAALDPAWSITGTVGFDGRIGGTTAKPTLDGIAALSSASLGREGIYTTLSMLNGNIRFSENRITFDNLEGRAGGGSVRFRGTGLIQNDQVEGLNVQIDVDQMRLRYPAGLRSSLSGSLVLKGSSEAPILDGNLRIDNMSYRSPFESFLEVFSPGGLNSGGTPMDNLRLSVHVAGNRNVIIQNELADVRSARIDLDIKGTLGSPSLTGHVEASGGTLLFQGKRYEITRGNIDFVDPQRIDPVVDIQAETDLRDYRVILAVTGRGERIRVEFRSDPPLPQLELVSLIAGGKTREELAAESGAASLPTSEQLFQGGAASILMDLLRSRVGNRFGLMGLDRVRIDPYIVGAGSNPSARITLSERVTKDLAVTYSQDLASSQQRIIQIEYFLSKDVSIVASREENNETTALGLDLRLRKRF